MSYIYIYIITAIYGMHVTSPHEMRRVSRVRNASGYGCDIAGSVVGIMRVTNKVPLDFLGTQRVVGLVNKLKEEMII